MRAHPAKPARPWHPWALAWLVLLLLVASTAHALRGGPMLWDTAAPMPHAAHDPPASPQTAPHDHCLLCTIQFTEPGPSSECPVAWGGPKHQPALLFSSPQQQRVHYLPTASRAPPTRA
ncbi:MAG TPA: hypothetical protein VFS50_07380 [Meiothermus sp.]|nr:hypothetical protein [Meiothermus sp.]